MDVSTRKPVATEEDQEHLNCPEDSVRKGKPVAPRYPGNPGNSGDSGTESNDEDCPHNLHISTNYVLHIEKVFSIVRQRYGRSPTDQMKDFDVNTEIWCIFMSVTLQAAVHLGTDYTEKLRTTKNEPKKPLRQLFRVTERLITDQVWTLCLDLTFLHLISLFFTCLRVLIPSSSLLVDFFSHCIFTSLFCFKRVSILSSRNLSCVLQMCDTLSSVLLCSALC